MDTATLAAVTAAAIAKAFYTIRECDIGKSHPLPPPGDTLGNL
jgi:hypothetical protein